MATIYTEGSAVRVAAAFSNSAGVATDPGAVLLKVRQPDGVDVVYTYGTDPELIRDSAGAYRCDLVPDMPGRWLYRWEGSGAILAAEEGFIDVADSVFV